MKPAVLRPCARSRSRCNIGNRTSACVPERKMCFASSRYLSSSPTSINAIVQASVALRFLCLSLTGPRFSLDILQLDRVDLRKQFIGDIEVGRKTHRIRMTADDIREMPVGNRQGPALRHDGDLQRMRRADAART